MERVILCLVLLPAIVFAINCKSLKDGNYEISCYQYTVCENGNATIKTCDQHRGQMFNTNTSMCDDRANVPAPCNLDKDCTLKKDGRYFDIETNCVSYYTCYAAHYYGHQFCPPGLVFDKKLQQCNWPYNVLPPCGTADPAAPPVGK